jgi:hypothetical protein
MRRRPRHHRTDGTASGDRSESTPGIASAESAELASARRRIQKLEAELAIHRPAAKSLKATTSANEIRDGRDDRHARPACATRVQRAPPLGVRLVPSAFVATPQVPRIVASGSDLIRKVHIAPRGTQWRRHNSKNPTPRNPEHPFASGYGWYGNSTQLTSGTTVSPKRA